MSPDPIGSRSPSEHQGRIFQTRRFEAQDGTLIWYGTLGAGPWLILCDGFACDGFIWPYIIDHFCDRFSILRWHYRGHGRSEVPEDLNALSLQHLCDDLLGIMDELGIDEAILLGHSMGAQVIFQFFERAPDRVRALVPICGTYKHPLDTFKNTDLLAKSLPYLDMVTQLAPDAAQALWSGVLSSKITYIVSQLVELNPKLVRGEDFKPYLEHAGAMDVRVYLTMLHYLGAHSAEHILPTIHIPTLVLAAEHDTFTPQWRAEEMHKLIPHSEYLLLPGATHVGPIELPDMVTGAIEKFFRAHDLDPALHEPSDLR
jgi:pimeloyl-ACP methyl ester carboxylesterase